MCGILGFAGPPDRELLGRMAAAIVHRGPDDAGSLERDTVSLGHRRLSIIDREGGHQPIANEDETVWLVYNGEVYNYRELRADLEVAGHTFRTSCDSEVIVHAYEEWGPACAARFNGMWAFAVADFRGAAADGSGGKLVLNRDHFGIKPLFYARSPESGRLVFASEIKALLQDPELRAKPDEQMIFEYLQHGFHDHRAETFFRGVYHVPAANWIEIPLAGVGAADAGEEGAATATTTAATETTTAPGLLTRPLTSVEYWSPELRSDASADPADFRRRFRDSVERRLVSEVPVGSCLSGGLDSTTIVGFMSELLKEAAPDAASLRGQLKTFSAVFDGDPIDEREYIEIAVESTGADTTYTNPTSPEFVDELRDFIWHQEEPIVSTGPYAQWCVMRSAREQVTVLLDGQGGDELIAGYVPYQLVYLRQLRKEHRYEELRREAVKSRDVLWPLAKRRIKQRRKKLPTQKLLEPAFVARTTDPGYGRSQDDLKERLLQDLLTYSLPCLLRYEDRNSMAFSIESRVPYLDQELVDHILHLPDDAIIRHGWSRWILRAALKGTLPEKIRLRRWKVGFTTPEMRWIKARRAAFTSLYQSPTFQTRPYWDGAAVVSAFRACCRGEVEESMFFWRAANIELWLREFVDRGAVLVDADIEAALTAPVEVGPRRRGSVAEAGDAGVPALLAAAAGPEGPAAAAEAERLLAAYRPNDMKHLFGALDGSVWARVPLKTELVGRGDDLIDLYRRQIVEHVKPGDIVVMAEKPIAASQGRSYAVDEIHPTRLAKVLSKAVTRTPHGIGLGIPETMQLAIDEAGAPRIVAAAAASAAGKVVGKRGLFYKVAGANVEAIDGPTWNTLPPHNTHAKLGPADPDGVAAKLADFLSESADGRVEMVVIDANDLTATVLGASPGADRGLAATLMRDNPLGQGHEQTPVCVLRRLGPLPSRS
ncbi:MAG TPA: asparagine synthase (glutamine-hydrolyzing) [Thermoleophilia bacterium]|nr:asparagine synthase (glutamine-hydrolyzing) [Thermoleophilia bacterium]